MISAYGAFNKFLSSSLNDIADIQFYKDLTRKTVF